MAKPQAAVLLLKRALNAGIHADYVLMDSWFTTEPVSYTHLAHGSTGSLHFEPRGRHRLDHDV